jgi:hypothetical protein
LTSEAEQVSCGVHGRASAAFVCAHLAENPLQRWHCDCPSEKNPWPDAWCDKCEDAFQREGAWNERNEEEAGITHICHHCYERLRGESVRRIDQFPPQSWQAFLEECRRELDKKQARLFQDRSIPEHDRYDWDQDRGEIIFSDAKAIAIARIEFVGSISAQSNTWLWSWANFSLSQTVRSRITVVRDFGAERDIAHLTTPKWPATEVDGWDMTAIAAHILRAEGAYRTEMKDGFTYMLLSDVRLAQ